jgi:hypothetical protein
MSTVRAAGVGYSSNDLLGDRGLKATKAAIIRQAQLAKKDIAGGRVSTHAQQAVDTLADYSNAAVELLELALDEAAKKQPDTALVDSFIFLFGQASEALRLEIEAGYKTASNIAEKVRKRLVAASQTGASNPSTVLSLVQSFGAAKLDLGEELPGVVEHLIEQVGAANAGDCDPAAMLGFVADMVKQVAGDAFALFSCIEESSVGVPDESRTAMATALLFSGVAAAAEASIGWLLDSATPVRRATANALGDAARTGKVTPTMLRRMITMRNWLPEDSRSPLDAAIATARRKGVAPAQWDEVEVRELITTGVDGSGAIGMLSHCRNKRKNVLGSLMLKHGVGVRDAWAQEGITQKELDGAFLNTAVVDQFAIKTDFLPTAVGHFLALGHQTGAMPPFGLVYFLEAVGVSSVQPGLMSPASLLETIEEGRAIGADPFEHLLADGFELAADYVFIGSWFEAGDEVDAVLMRNRQVRNKREALIMEKVLEPRREWWTQVTAWAACILYRAGNDERWQEFHAMASAMLQGRPLGEISLMHTVASQTVLAWEHRQDH